MPARKLDAQFREQTVMPKRATPCSEPVKETTAKKKGGGGGMERRIRERGTCQYLIVSSSCMLNGGFGGEEKLIINLHNVHRDMGGGTERATEQDAKGLEIIKKEIYFLYTKALSH